MRIAAVAAGVLACAAAAMAVAAFTAGGEEEPAPDVPAPAPATTAANGGEAVWVEHGCGSCHAFAAASATGQFAPDLASSLKGMPASYIRESIVAPAKVIAPGYPGGEMPEDFASRMSPAELERLVEFIRAGVPR